MKICLDIGGCNIKSALVDKGRIVKKFTTNTGAHKGRKAVLRNILKSIESVYDTKAGSINIGMPGPADYKKGIIGNTLNLPLSGFNINKFLSEKFNKKIKFDNDANCFTLGEAVFGGGKNYDVVMGLTLGTGIGGGLVIDKKIFHGRGNAAEFGHILMGNTDWEHHFKKLKDRNGNIKDYNLLGHYLGIGIVSLIHCFDPDIIIIGGGIANNFNKFRNEMNKTIAKNVLFRPCKIVRSGLRDSALLGANLL